MKKGFKLEERYLSLSAHSTFIRYKNVINSRADLLNYVIKNQEIELGKFKVEKLELVIHDWYNRMIDKVIETKI